MNGRDRRRIRKIIEQVAVRQSASAETVRREMQIAIDAAHSERYEPGHEAYIRMFGDRKPSVEEFILCTAAHIQSYPCKGEPNEGKSQ